MLTIDVQVPEIAYNARTVNLEQSFWSCNEIQHPGRGLNSKHDPFQAVHGREAGVGLVNLAGLPLRA